MRTRSDLILDFSELFERIEHKDNEIKKEDWVGYYNIDKTMMVVPKLLSIKDQIINNFKHKEDRIIPLDYNVQIMNGSQDKLKVFARISGETNDIKENKCVLQKSLVKIILKLVTKTRDGRIIFKFRKNYPAWIETSEMVVIIAPMTDAEE